MGKVDKIVSRLAKEDFFDALKKLDDYARKKDDKASDIIDKFVAVKQDQITDNQKFQLKKKIENGNYRYLHFEFANNGAVFIAAAKNTEKDEAAKAARRKTIKNATIALIVLIAVAAGGYYIYTTFIQEHPLETVTMAESNIGTLDVANYYTVSVDLSPSNASDKEIKWSADSDDVILEPNGTSVKVFLKPSATSGDKIVITAYNERYKLTASQTITVVNDISLALTSASETVSSGDSFSVNSGLAEKYQNCTIDWSTDNQHVTINGNWQGADVILSDSVNPNETINVTARVHGTDIVKNFNILVDGKRTINLSSSQVGSTVSVKSVFTDVTIIGERTRTYNTTIVIDARSNELNLTLRDLNINAPNNSSALVGTSNPLVNIIIDGVVNMTGSNSNGDGYPAIDVKNATIKLNGSLNARGGNGGDGSASNGKNGGVAIKATELTVLGTGVIECYGGNGGNGSNSTYVATSGYNGNNGVHSSHTRATAGGTGGAGGAGYNGGNGGIAINSSILTFSETFDAVLTGGTGGNGGNGSMGGTGGKGGTGVNYGKGEYNDWSPPSIHAGDAAKGGKGGTGGAGGNGGNGGLATSIAITYDGYTGDCTHQSGNGGAGGAGGKGGTGGRGGDGSNEGWQMTGASDVHYSSTGDLVSDAGDGGDGGDGGKGGKGGDGATPGTVGAGGEKGSGGSPGTRGSCNGGLFYTTYYGEYGDYGSPGNTGSPGNPGSVI